MSLKVNLPLLQAKQRKMERILDGQTSYFRPHLTRVGLRVRVWHTENFRARGIFTGNGRPWRDVSWVTAVLRKGPARKLVSWPEIQAFAKTLHPLMNTGDLMRSVMGNGANAVLKVDKLTVVIGVVGVKADLMNFGGSSMFRFTPDMEKRLEKNIAKVTRKGKPVSVPTASRRVSRASYEYGRGNVASASIYLGSAASRAKAYHNPVYYQARGYLRKISGTFRKVKPRQFIFTDKQITPARKAQLEAIITETDREYSVKL